MPNPLLPIAANVVGVSVGTMVAEKVLMSPKTIGLFYVDIAKACYASTGSKRIACGVAALTCGTALIPGPHQGTFLVACATAARGANKIIN